MMDVERGDGIPLQAAESVLVKVATQQVRMGFVRKVYAILVFQLILTAAIAAPLQVMSEQWLANNSWMLGVSVDMMLITVIVMACCSGVARSYPTNYILLFLLTAFEGVVVGFVSATYTASSVILCLGITAVVFLCLTVYAWNTKTDFAGFGPYLFGMLLSLLVFGLVMGILAVATCTYRWYGGVRPHYVMLILAMCTCP